MPDSYLLKGLTHHGIYVRRYLTEKDVSGDSKSRVRVGEWVCCVQFSIVIETLLNYGKVKPLPTMLGKV
jgi:hypothetical protein